MIIKAEKPALPDMNNIVGRVRVQKAPIQNRDFGFRDRAVITVYICGSLNQFQSLP